MSTDTISLKDFLSEFSEELKDRVKSELKPLYDPKNRDVLDIKRASRLDNLKRKLFPAQEDAVLAVTKGFQVARGETLCGEMGTGKTIMALAVAYLLDAKRVLVMCPGHLVQKWIREAEETIPGCTVINLNGKSMAELVNLRKNRTKPKNMEVWVIGKERAKLHYQIEGVISCQGKSKALYEQKHIAHNGYCPRCGREIDPDLIESVRKNKKTKCINEIRTNDDGTTVLCGEPLYQPGGRFRRYAKAEYIKRYLKGAFDLFLADEVHELKGGGTGQGQAFADLASSCKRTLALTGTLLGGYSTNLYYIMWRLNPQKMNAKGLKYGKTMQFAKLYGILEHVYVEDGKHNVASIGGTNRKLVSSREKPGISPLILTDMLLENSVFVRLSDVSKSLPPYDEIIVPVSMDEIQKIEYKDFEETLTNAVKEALARGDKRLLGKMINSLLAYPDGCRKPELITLMNDNGVNEVIAEAPALDIDVLPKEEKIIELAKQELAEGRKCLVCLEHTGTRDLIPEIVEKFEREGIRLLVLRSNTVSTEKREAWVKEKIATGEYDGLITNPRLVQTGLDLYEFPTILFFQTGYSIYTLRQTSRRSWRIGQNKDVRVYYLSYAETVQEKALTLIASKLETAMAVEGDLSDKGLAAIANSESSMLFALARELLGNRHENKSSLQEVWNRYKKQEVESDSYLNDPETTETVTTTYTKGDHTASVQYQQVVRGMVYAQRTIGGEFIGVAHVDGKHEFIFFKGDIYYRKKKVGSYDKKHGELNGKPIRLIEVPGKKQFVLYELKAA